MGELVAEQTEIAVLKRENVRETLERLHSQSTDLMQLAVQWKDLECRFDSIQKSIDDKACDLERKERQLEWKSKYLKQKCREMEAKMEEVRVREKGLEDEKKGLEDRCLEVDQTYELVAKCHARVQETTMRLEENLRLVRLKKRRLVPKENRLSVKRKVMKRKFGLLKNLGEELVTKEKRLHDFEAELNVREKNLNVVKRGLLKNIQEFDCREKRLEHMEIELRRKEKSYRERYKVFVNNERCLNSVLAKMKGEEVDDADIKFYITMNGRDLVGFLSSHVDDLNMIGDEVTRALKLSSNPAKLVLDAMQEFYGDSKLEENSDMSIVRRSCIVLLEQLTELEPQIGILESERAMLLAFDWKERMKTDEYQDLEIVGFLQLVCAFRLTNDFDKDELAKSIASVAHHACAPALCCRLGLEDKVQDIVEHLIQDMHAVEAVRFIHEFKLMDKFPPATILRDYLESVVLAADNISAGDLTKKQATTMIVASLVSVMKCIKDFNLDSEFPTESFEGQVMGLQRLMECFSSSEEPPMEVISKSASAKCNLRRVCDPVPPSNCASNPDDMP